MRRPGGLAKSERTFKLVFPPFVFARGGSLEQAIDERTKKAPLSLDPRLAIAARSIEVAPPDKGIDRMSPRGRYCDVP